MTDGRKWSAAILIIIATVAIAAGVLVGWLAPGARDTTGNQDMSATAALPTEEFQRRVRSYLIENPEVIVEAVQRYEAQRLAATRTETKSFLAGWEAELLRDPESPVGGNPQGDVTLVEFTDYNCPYCRRVAPLLPEAEAADPMLRIVYKEIPILGKDSVYAAKAALAADRQGKYVALHRALMNAKGVAAEGLVLAIAAKVGVDIERLKADIQDPLIQEAIDRNLGLARALRINGTPTFVIGDEIVQGAIDLKTIRTLIRKARELKQGR